MDFGGRQDVQQNTDATCRHMRVARRRRRLPILPARFLPPHPVAAGFDDCARWGSTAGLTSNAVRPRGSGNQRMVGRRDQRDTASASLERFWTVGQCSTIAHSPGIAKRAA